MNTSDLAKTSDEAKVEMVAELIYEILLEEDEDE